jgi:hypothetical protein
VRKRATVNEYLMSQPIVIVDDLVEYLPSHNLSILWICDPHSFGSFRKLIGDLDCISCVLRVRRYLSRE